MPQRSVGSRRIDQDDVPCPLQRPQRRQRLGHEDQWGRHVLIRTTVLNNDRVVEIDCKDHSDFFFLVRFFLGLVSSSGSSCGISAGSGGVL